VSCIFFFDDGLKDFLLLEKLEVKDLTDSTSEFVSELYTDA
jgi:hypothetical protein